MPASAHHLMDDRQHAKLRVLRDVFGYPSFRDGQERVVDCLLAGESVLAVMPTGAGKSLCFQVPALILGGLAIVVSPLVALMEDQVSALKLAGVAAEAINSARSREVNVATWRAVAAGEITILYLAPERLMTERMLAALSRLPVSLFAIDEAHCLSQWGPSFRPEYAQLAALSERFPDVPIVALTATADEATRKDIETHLFPGDHAVFVSGFDRPNIKLIVTPKASWKSQLIDFVLPRRGESGIVYCLSRKKTEEVTSLLRENGINALSYHAGLSAEERRQNQDRFVTEDAIVVAATIAFGMGIDKPDVRYVFHTDLPGSIEAYYQEVGRAGRDGAPAVAHMLFGPGDIRLRRQFIEAENTDNHRKVRENRRLDAFIGFADAVTCRRQALLAYFGEVSAPCGNCDICDTPAALSDGTEEALLVFEAILESRSIYGQAHIIDVLRGVATEKAVKAGHDQLAVFGKGAGFSKALWTSIIRQMLSSGYLAVDVAGYSALQITATGNALSRGKGLFQFRREEGPAHPNKSRDKPKATGAAREMSARDHKLLVQLKAERLDIARLRGVPAFVVFPDKTLEEMAIMRPASLESMAEVKGVGQVKLKTFGPQFLAVITSGN